MTQIFKTSDYSRFKTIPSAELSEDEKTLFSNMEFVWSDAHVSNPKSLWIGTHYENIENRKKGIRKVYGYAMHDLNGETFEIQVWHRPKLDPQRIDN